MIFNTFPILSPMPRIVRGQISAQTNLQIDYGLKKRAKEAGLNMSQILTAGIEKELKKKKDTPENAPTGGER
jgi:post-segregation antitoxin (ccd killing protein)